MSDNVRIGAGMLPGLDWRDFRNMLRGVTQVPQAPFAIAGMFGNERAADISMRMGDFFNNLLGTQDVSLTEDPRAALAQIIGGSVVGVPAGLIPRAAQIGAAIAQAPRPVRAAINVAEALTPVTVPLTAGRIGANIAGGAAVDLAFSGLDALAGQPGDNDYWIELPDGTLQLVRPGHGQASTQPTTQTPTTQTTPTQPTTPTPTPTPQTPTAAPMAAATGAGAGVGVSGSGGGSGSGGSDASPAPSADPLRGPDGYWAETTDGRLIFYSTAPSQPEQDDRTWLQIVRDNAIPALVAAGAIGAGISGFRRQQASRQAREELRSRDTVAIGNPPPEDIARPTIGERLATQVIDETAAARGFVREAERAGFITPDERASLDADLQTTLARAVRETRAHAALRRGVAPDGYDLRTVRMPDGTRRTVFSQRELQDRMETLIREQPELHADVVQVQALLDELSNRQRAAATGTTSRIAPNEPARVGMTHKSLADIERELAAITRRSPQVREYIDEHAAWAESRRQYLVRAGRITPAMAAKWRRANIHYVPDYDPYDVHTGYMSLRRIREGGLADRPQSYVDARLDYDIRMITETELNRARRNVIRGLERIQNAARLEPTKAPRLLKQIIGPIHRGKVPEPDDRANTMRWWENGEQYSVQIYVPEVYQALRSAPSMTGGILNTTRLWGQELTTGVLAALTGPVQAPISALYTTWLMTAAPMSRLATGRLDRLLRRVTNDRLTLGMLDPTMYPGIAWAMAQDFAAMSVRVLSDVARRELLSSHSLVRKMVGGERLAALLRRLDDIYENSIYAEMRRMGAIGNNPITGADFTGGAPPSVAALSPSYQAVRPRDWHFPTNIRELRELVGDALIRSPLGPKVVETWQLAREAFDIIASSPQSMVYRLNRDDYMRMYNVQPEDRGVTTTRRTASPEREQALSVLTSRVRRVTGDPALRPANRTMQGVESTFMYATIMKQGLAQYGKMFRDNPVRTTMAMVTSVIIPTTLALYNAMVQDEEDIANGLEPTRVRDLVFNAPHRVAGTLPFYLPGLPTEQALRVPYDQPLGPLVAAAQAILLSTLGADDPKFYSEGMRQNRELLRRLIEERHTYTMWEALQRGMGELAPPPLIASAVGAAGYDMRDFISIRPSLQPTEQRGAGGYFEGQTYTDTMPNWAVNVLNSWGSVGQFVARMLPMFMDQEDLEAAQRRLQQDARPTLSALGDIIGQRFGDRATIAAPLLSGPRSQPSFDITSEYVRDIERKMRELQQGSRDATRPGVLGSGRERFVETQYDWLDRLPPQDQAPMRAIVQQVVRGFNNMQSLRDERNSLYSAMVALNSDPILRRDPIALRYGQNWIANRIRDVNVRIVESIVNLEQHISNEFGIQFRIENFNPARGMRQFTPTTPSPSQ
jgi:hypothetical protein